MTQLEIEAIQAQRRAEHEAKMQVLHAQEMEIQKQRSILKAELKAGNRLLESLKQSTPHSILNNRKRVGYILRHKIGELLSEFKCKKHYDTANNTCNFNIEEDGTMTITITIPPKEEQIDYPCKRCKHSLKINDGSLVCSKLTCKGEHLIIDKEETCPPCNGEFYETELSQS